MLESENINSEESNNYYSANTNYYIKEAKKVGYLSFSKDKSWRIFYIRLFFLFGLITLYALATPSRMSREILWIAPWYIWLLVIILFIIFSVFFLGYEYRFIIDFITLAMKYRKFVFLISSLRAYERGVAIQKRKFNASAL